jgi:hypothetical protein
MKTLAETFTREGDDADSLPPLRKRWIMLISIGTMSLSLLFLWGFLHLILVLIFPKPGIVH